MVQRGQQRRCRCSSFVVRRSLFVVRRSSFVVCRSSFVVRRSSFVVRRRRWVNERRRRTTTNDDERRRRTTTNDDERRRTTTNDDVVSTAAVRCGVAVLWCVDFVRSFRSSFVGSEVRSLVEKFVCWFVAEFCWFVGSLVHWLVRFEVRSLVRSEIGLVGWLVCSEVRSLVRWFVGWLVGWLVRSFGWLCYNGGRSVGVVDAADLGVLGVWVWCFASTAACYAVVLVFVVLRRVVACGPHETGPTATAAARVYATVVSSALVVVCLPWLLGRSAFASFLVG